MCSVFWMFTYSTCAVEREKEAQKYTESWRPGGVMICLTLLVKTEGSWLPFPDNAFLPHSNRCCLWDQRFFQFFQCFIRTQSHEASGDAQSCMCLPRRFTEETASAVFRSDVAVRNSFHFQRTLTKEVTEVFKEAVNIFSNQISCSIKMVISMQKCRTSSGIAKHLKNDITKIRKKTSLAHAKPLILQFDTFLIVYVCIIFYFIFARLGCTRLQRGKMEYWYLARKETCCLSHQCSSCRPCCPSATEGDCVWVIPAVFASTQNIAGTEGESSFVQRGWQSIVPAAKGLPYLQDPVSEQISDGMNTKSVTTSRVFLTQPLGICCIAVSGV